mmetsp:Transcript_6107/g.10238  ORF Transcript_6107/g.10238 Transcript_6107/m.10238 type:complete len:107 (+) Transcript_6107:93-413(+)
METDVTPIEDPAKFKLRCFVEPSRWRTKPSVILRDLAKSLGNVLHIISVHMNKYMVESISRELCENINKLSVDWGKWWFCEYRREIVRRNFREGSGLYPTRPFRVF